MAMLEMTRQAPFLDSMPLLNNGVGLRERAHRDGYLFFREFIEPESILRIRRLVLGVCERHGWLDGTAPLMDGVARPGKVVIESDNPDWRAAYADIQRLHDFHALAFHPRVLDTLTRMFDEQAIPHSRNICRVVFPGTARYTTPPHQDHWYIGGTQETWTAWIPLGDCPDELGGLAILPGSHRLGVLSMRPADGPGGHTIQEAVAGEWAAGPLRCGDVLLFHSLTVHQGRDNLTDDRLRLSVDFRYQPISEPVRRDSMEPHGWFVGSWDDLYRDWPVTSSLRYYWHAWDLNFA